MLEIRKSKGYGTTFYTRSSKAISQITFYSLSIDYKSYYFATVKFTSNYVKECIYKVGSFTKSNYSLNNLNNAGEVFCYNEI